MLQQKLKRILEGEEPYDIFVRWKPLEKQPLGIVSLDLRTSGQQFDDSANQFRLAGYTQVDLYAEHSLWERVRVYGSVQNLADSRIEAGRTPTLTLASPRIVVFGLRVNSR